MMKVNVEADQFPDMDGRTCLPRVEGGKDKGSGIRDMPRER
jgi:hypothetical protein